MTQFIVISYACGLAALIDAYRRPLAAWQHADRDRGYWGMMGGFVTLIGLGLFFAVAYLFGVVGRFSADGSSGGDFGKNDFRR